MVSPSETGTVLCVASFGTAVTARFIKYGGKSALISKYTDNQIDGSVLSSEFFMFSIVDASPAATGTTRRVFKTRRASLTTMMMSQHVWLPIIIEHILITGREKKNKIK